MKRLLLILPLLYLLLASPVYAISSPDSGPYITQVDVYRHSLESDDMLVVARYNVPYTSVPDEAISQAYIGRLVSGSTELARVSPYSYYNKGYGYGVFSMYLDAASAAGLWEDPLTVELRGSPTLAWLATTATSAVTGAVADDGGSQTDQTTAANNATTNDMTLLPATPAIHDAYYYGDDNMFSIITQNIGTAGAGSWTFAWEYYNGSGWTLLSGVVDGTDAFTAPTGNHDVTFTVPSDWTATTIQSISAYWIRARVYDYVSITTQPLGTQCWVNSDATAPLVATSSLNWRSTTSASATQSLMYSNLIAYADELSDYWSVALTTSTAAGTKLSSYGETYFTNTITGLRTMCPALFSAAVTVPQYEDIEWQMGGAEATKAAWPLDWSGVSEWIGMPGDDEVFRTLIGFGLVFLLCSIMVATTNRADFALLAGYGMLFVFAVPGWISPVIVAGFTFLSVVVGGLVFILGKAS